MRYEKDPEQRFHTKTKQIFRKSVYSSSSCATCEWCRFSASPPCRPGCWVKQRSAPMSRLHDTPMARIHRCQGSYYWKKLLLKWNEDQRPQRALLSTESGVCLQESCSSDSTLGACYLLLIHETTPNRAKAPGKQGNKSAAATGTGSSACLPKTSVHPHIQGFHLQLQAAPSWITTPAQEGGPSLQPQELCRELRFVCQPGQVCVWPGSALHRGCCESPALCTELGWVWGVQVPRVWKNPEL